MRRRLLPSFPKRCWTFVRANVAEAAWRDAFGQTFDRIYTITSDGRVPSEVVRTPSVQYPGSGGRGTANAE